jgi:hypothetical protein
MMEEANIASHMLALLKTLSFLCNQIDQDDKGVESLAARLGHHFSHPEPSVGEALLSHRCELLPAKTTEA